MVKTADKKEKQLTRELEALRQSVKELEHLEELYSILSDNSLNGFYLLAGNRFLFTNSQFQKITGYSKEELSKINTIDLVHPEDREEVKRNSAFMLEGNLSTPHEFRVITKDGQVRRLLDTINFITYMGKRVVFGNSVDITMI